MEVSNTIPQHQRLRVRLVRLLPQRLRLALLQDLQTLHTLQAWEQMAEEFHLSPHQGCLELASLTILSESARASLVAMCTEEQTIQPSTPLATTEHGSSAKQPGTRQLEQLAILNSWGFDPTLLLPTFKTRRPFGYMREGEEQVIGRCANTGIQDKEER